MSTTLIQLRHLVRSRLGIPASDRFNGDAIIDAAVNLATDAVEAEQRWPWQECVTTATTTASAADMDMPSDWASSRALFIDGSELINVAPADLYRYATSAEGQPEVWAVIGSTIYLRPVPDTAYTITHLYYRAHSPLVADLDRIDLPDKYAVAVVAKAAEQLAIREDDRGAAVAHLAEYVTAISRMRRDVRRSTGPTRIRVREGGWV